MIETLTCLAWSVVAFGLGGIYWTVFNRVEIARNERKRR